MLCEKQREDTHSNTALDIYLYSPESSFPFKNKCYLHGNYKLSAQIFTFESHFLQKQGDMFSFITPEAFGIQ